MNNIPEYDIPQNPNALTNARWIKNTGMSLFLMGHKTKYMDDMVRKKDDAIRNEYDLRNKFKREENIDIMDEARYIEWLENRLLFFCNHVPKLDKPKPNWRLIKGMMVAFVMFIAGWISQELLDYVGVDRWTSIAISFIVLCVVLFIIDKFVARKLKELDDMDVS